MDGLIILLVIGVVSAVIILSILFTMERRKKMAAYAESQGWHFTPDKDKGMSDRYPSFKCLRRGHSRWAYNIMRGDRDGRDVTAFDYHYVTGHGKNRQVHNFSALVLQSPLTLKPLYIRPENVFDKVSDFFGKDDIDAWAERNQCPENDRLCTEGVWFTQNMLLGPRSDKDDIDFESAEFSRKFFVKAPEKRWAYHVIHQQMMEYLLEAPSFHIQFDSRDVMVWRNRRFREQDFDEAFTLIQGMLERLPEYVKKQLEGEAGQAGGSTQEE